MKPRTMITLCAALLLSGASAWTQVSAPAGDASSSKAGAAKYRSDVVVALSQVLLQAAADKNFQIPPESPVDFSCVAWTKRSPNDGPSLTCGLLTKIKVENVGGAFFDVVQADFDRYGGRFSLLDPMSRAPEVNPSAADFWAHAFLLYRPLTQVKKVFDGNAQADVQKIACVDETIIDKARHSEGCDVTKLEIDMAARLFWKKFVPAATPTHPPFDPAIPR
jgi:hypothetical protein